MSGCIGMGPHGCSVCGDCGEEGVCVDDEAGQAIAAVSCTLTQETMDALSTFPACTLISSGLSGLTITPEGTQVTGDGLNKQTGIAAPTPSITIRQVPIDAPPQKIENVEIVRYEWCRPKNTWYSGGHDGDLGTKFGGVVAIETNSGWLILTRREKFWNNQGSGGFRQVPVKYTDLPEFQPTW